MGNIEWVPPENILLPLQSSWSPTDWWGWHQRLSVVKNLKSCNMLCTWSNNIVEPLRGCDLLAFISVCAADSSHLLSLRSILLWCSPSFPSLLPLSLCLPSFASHAPAAAGSLVSWLCRAEDCVDVRHNTYT